MLLTQIFRAMDMNRFALCFDVAFRENSYFLRRVLN